MTSYFSGQYVFRTVQPVQYALWVRPDAAATALANLQEVQAIIPLTASEDGFTGAYLGFAQFARSAVNQMLDENQAYAIGDLYEATYNCNDRSGDALGYQQAPLLNRRHVLSFVDPNAHANSAFYQSLNEAWRQPGWHLWFGDGDWLYTLPGVPSVNCQWVVAQPGAKPVPAGIRNTCVWTNRALPQPWACRGI